MLMLFCVEIEFFYLFELIFFYVSVCFAFSRVYIESFLLVWFKFKTGAVIILRTGGNVGFGPSGQ